MRLFLGMVLDQSAVSPLFPRPAAVSWLEQEQRSQEEQRQSAQLHIPRMSALNWWPLAPPPKPVAVRQIQPINCDGGGSNPSTKYRNAVVRSAVARGGLSNGRGSLARLPHPLPFMHSRGRGAPNASRSTSSGVRATIVYNNRTPAVRRADDDPRIISARRIRLNSTRARLHSVPPASSRA